MILIVHVSRKIAKILTVSHKSHHPIETLFYWNSFVSRNKKYLKSELKIPLFFSLQRYRRIHQFYQRSHFQLQFSRQL